MAVVNEEESICKKAVAALFKVQRRHFSRGTEEEKQNIVLGNQYPGRNSIRSCLNPYPANVENRVSS